MGDVEVLIRWLPFFSVSGSSIKDPLPVGSHGLKMKKVSRAVDISSAMFIHRCMQRLDWIFPELLVIKDKARDGQGSDYNDQT